MIEYDKPIEVTQNQYNKALNYFAGIVAGRIEKGKFYIKLWIPKYKSYLEDFLQKTT